ncbi:MAG: pitrilysin family protein [Pseudomonadota bacterium]
MNGDNAIRTIPPGVNPVMSAGHLDTSAQEVDGDAPRISTLANGFRIVTHRMPHLKTVSLGVWVGAGACHETDRLHGISHLLEHMAFKGTARRSAKRIAEEIEEVGGDLNASTSLETTAYYARILEGDEALAIDVLGDILLSSTFDETELKREQDVILHEIAASQDSPDDLVYDLFQEVAYPNQPLGRTILGTPESITAIGPDDLRAYLAQSYAAGRMVLSAAGAVDHEAVVAEAERVFGSVGGPVAARGSGATYGGGIRATRKPFEQSHVLIGFDGPAYGQPDFFTAQVMSGLFGGGMSSRLFQEARENRGLCYAIYSTTWGLSDSGIFAMHAATSSDMVDPLAEVMAEALADVAAHGPSEAETLRSKAQLKAGLLMSLESSFTRAEQMARHLLAHDRLISSEELIGDVEKVTAEDIQAYAQKLMAGRPCVAVVGSGDEAQAQAELAHSLFRRAVV